MGSSSSPLWLRALAVVARFGVAVLLIGAGGGVFVILSNSKVEPEPVAAAESVLPVRSVLATPMPMPRVYTGYGTARAMDTSVVSAQVAARVAERPEHIEPGVRVEAGDLLVRLDATDFEARVDAGRQRIMSLDAQLEALETEQARLSAQYELAREEVEIARRDLERIREAADAGSGTVADVDQRITTLRRAERTLEGILQAVELLPSRRSQLQAERSGQLATLRLDEENLSRTEVRAPISGVLQTVDAEAGEYLRIGDPIARVVSLSRIEVPLRLPLAALRSISDQVGLPVALKTDGRVPQTWTGRLVRVAPESDASSRTVTAFVEVDQGDSPDAAVVLTPGQFVMGRIEPDDGELRVVLPRRAVVGDRVYIAVQSDEGPARVRPVPVRVSHYVEGELPAVEPGETQWAVLEPWPAGGLEPGSRVIVSNLDVLAGGEAVEAIGGAERSGADPVAEGSS